MNLCVVFLSVLVKTVASFFCYWNSGCPYKYFSDKTPYNNVRGDIRDSIVKLKDCEPISMWALLSDGKNIPDNFLRSLNESQAIKDNVLSSYKHGKSSLCAQDIENLRTWSTDSEILSKPNFLSDEGSQELIGIANRLRQAFPELLQNLKGNYKIAQASGGVTEDSAKNFLKGFSSERLNIEKAGENISPYKTCMNYQKELQNPNAFKEVRRYKSSPEYLVNQVLDEFKSNGVTLVLNSVFCQYQVLDKFKSNLSKVVETIVEFLKQHEKTRFTAFYNLPTLVHVLKRITIKDRIQRRLGIDNELSDDSVKYLYDMCRYTWSGINNKFSPWCALFTTEDLRALEYLGDLETYYRNGYGIPMNQRLGKITLEDLLINFQNARQGKGKIIVAYFTDTATLNMVAAALNLFKDDSPLTDKRNPKRKWRNSKISVFSANLISVLNKCGKGADVDYNVVFYWNEEPLLPICESGFCSWDELLHKLQPQPAVDSEIDFCNK